MARVPGRRPLWLTVPLYAVLLVVVVLDVRAAVFWGRVGGSLGTPVALPRAGSHCWPCCCSGSTCAGSCGSVPIPGTTTWPAERPPASAQSSGSSPPAALALSAVRTASSTLAENPGSLSARCTTASIISGTALASMVSIRVPPASR